ncbi:MAG: triose-phosphate isomerase [Planctomycetota bacterium]
MAQRVPFVGGNWKMNLDRSSGAALAAAVAQAARAHRGAEVCVFPPYPYLEVVHSALAGGAQLGAQDCSDQKSGAFTGQVAAAMLADVGCSAVLIGHSERRHGLGERDPILSEKLRRAIEAGLLPVLCVGETLAERESGRAHDVIETQLRGCLSAHSEDAMARLVVAYEPVWAIGTGRTATPDDAADAHRTVRRTLADLYSARFSDSVRVIYGGSVNAKNAAELFLREEIDGGLVGGASLKADEFTAILAAASARATR